MDRNIFIHKYGPSSDYYARVQYAMQDLGTYHDVVAKYGSIYTRIDREANPDYDALSGELDELVLPRPR